MAYIQIPAFSKITNLNDDYEFVIVVDGVEYLVSFKTLSEKFGNSPELLQQINAEIEALRNIIDAFPTENPAAPIALKIADTPTIDGMYKPTEIGVYLNAGGLEYDPTEGITYFIRTNGVWTKDVTPVNFIPTGVVEEGNTEAVSGNEVYDKIKEVTDPIYNLVDSPNLADPNNIYVGKAINPGINVIYDIAGYDSIVFLVDPTKTYTITGWNSTRSEIAFFSNDLPPVLPSGHYSTGIIDAATVNDMFGYGKVSGKITFQPLPTSKWGIILIKSNVETNSVYSEFQIEEGSIATPYYPFGYKSYQLKPELKPDELSEKLNHSSNDKAETGVSVSEFIEDVLKPFADVIYSKNLADPNTIYQNFAISTAGIYSNNGFTIIIQPVDFTKTYTVSGWDSFRDYIAFYSGDVPNTATNLPPNLIQAGRINPVLGISKNGDKATFQPLPNSTWMALLVKDPSELDSVYQQLQIEEGSSVTEYIPFEGVTSKFKLTTESDSKLNLRKTGDNILIRTSFNDVKDLVRSMALHGNYNGAGNLTSSKLISKTDSISAVGEVFHPMNDTIPPAFQVDVATNEAHLNVAGNHGLKSITDITSSTPHGKTSADLGSIWADNTGWEFYLIAIVSPTVLRIASKPQNISGQDRVKINPVSPISHISGATNTASVNYTGGSYEYKPSIRDISVRLFIDDIEVLEDGNYSGSTVKVSEFYEVADPTKPNLTPPYLPQNNGLMLKYNLTHIFNYDNTSTHEGVADWSSNHYTKSHLVIVPQTMNKVSYTDVMTYANNVGVKGIHNWDTGVNFNADIPAYVTIVKEDLKDQNFHYNQFSHLIFNGENPIIGGGYGLLPIDQGTSELQLLNDSILEFSIKRKGHPRPFTGMTDNKVFRSIGYFSYWDASKNPKFSAAYSVKYGNVDYYMIQLKDECVKEILFMNDPLKNRLYEVIHKTDGLIIHTNSSTTNNGLVLSGGIGDWAILIIR